MNASISISKVITVITGNSVYSISAADFADEIIKFSSIEVHGWFSTNKYNKYQYLILKSGFCIDNVKIFDLKEEGKSIDFRVIFKKI